MPSNTLHRQTLLQNFKALHGGPQDAAHGFRGSISPLPLELIYTQDIEFHDPERTLLGILALRRHLRTASLSGFEYLDEMLAENSATLTWRAQIRHPLVPRKRLMTLRGVTQVRFTDRIYYQEDFYDLGSTVYPRVPVVGPIIRLLQHYGQR